MPIYEYLCPAGHLSEHWTPLASRHENQVCRSCGVKATYKISAPRVFGDYPGYVSPATGNWVEGRKARLEDMRVSGCRPYEEGEMKDAVRYAAEREKELDATVDVAVEQTAAQLHL